MIRLDKKNIFWADGDWLSGCAKPSVLPNSVLMANDSKKSWIFLFEIKSLHF
jgi:hypothetical protein